MKTRQQTHQEYLSIIQDAGKDFMAAKRELAKSDLFFLLVYILHRKDIDRDWLFDRCREVQRWPDGYLDLWARDHYKENTLDSDIHTPKGLAKFSDIHPGDYIYAPSGKSVKIIAETSIQQDPVQYKIKFVSMQNDEFEEIKAGSQHLWDVKIVKRTVEKDFYEERLLNTQEIYEYTKHQKTLKRKRWLKVAIAKPLQKPEQELPIDPYTLGVWLGDGSCGCSAITNCSNELRDKLKGKIETVRSIKNTKVFCVHGLITKLKLLGLGDVKSVTKFIPKIYLKGSVKQRLELLRGLMDTDGGISKKGIAKFHSTSQLLAGGVKELVTSLGGISHNYYFNPLYIVSFSYNLIDCFTIKKHKEKLRNKELNYNYWYIKDIQRIKSEPAKCIQVEGGKYLIGKKLIPTHNSSIITYGLTIQDILNDPEITVGIFSFIRPIAKSFMRQIKNDFEANQELKELFPEIFWNKPKRESPKWSEDDGIVLKRKSNPKEATIEAWGLVDGMPTGRHYKLRVYDDIITEKSVTTPEMIQKVTQAWELSQNLGQEGGKQRMIGTRYHFADTYHVIMERGALKPREYPATENGKAKGKPVLLSEESLAQKRRNQGPYVFSCQLLLDPVAEEMQELKPKWLQYWPAYHFDNMNLYLFCDPAGEKKKTNDYTVFTVWGLGPDNNLYVIEWIRDRMNLTERANVLFALQRKYNPDRVIYEKYGMQSDIEHYQDRMNRENYRFRIEEIGGQVKKEDRIRKLIPLFEQGRVYLPETCIRVNLQGKAEDLTQLFIKEEYKLFPFSVHDDMLDCMARIVDIRTDRPDIVNNFMGLDFKDMSARNLMAVQDFQRKQQANDYNILTDGMR